MVLPRLPNVPSQSQMTIDSFKGINVTSSYADGELLDCLNIHSDAYPALEVRKKRTALSFCDGKINGVGSHDGFFYTFYEDDPKKIFLFYKDKKYEFTSYSDSDDFTLKRQFAYMENCIMIIPDHVIFYIDSKSFKSVNITQTVLPEDAIEKFRVESNNSSVYDVMSDQIRGDVTHNCISAKKIVYQPGSYVNYDFYYFSFDSRLVVGDYVKVKMNAFSTTAQYGDKYTSFLNKMKNGIMLKIKSFSASNHKTPSGNVLDIIKINFDDNAIDMMGLSDMHFDTITIEKKMPDVTNITSYNNRIWAVGKNKIYTSKLNDADEWNDFSVDSYGTLPSSCFSASAGTEGDFTAIIPHGNYIYAFKENYIHKIYGDTPDEYTISDLEAPGPVKTASTLCVCGVYLMYVSNDGVYILRDGYPKNISKKIGQIYPVCAASYGGKYYLLCSKGDERFIYVYDLEHDIWTMQSCSDDADNLCANSKGICFSEGGTLVSISADDKKEYEKDVRWTFRMRFDRNHFGQNTAIRAVARISLSKNASYTVRAFYDDDTRGAICGSCYDETQNGSSLLRLPVKRDLGFYLEFRGVGGFRMRSIKFNYYKSSEE